MTLKCSGCDASIPGLLFLKCSSQKCLKLYDLQCLNIPVVTFKNYTKELKNKWICPECTSLKPKMDNMDNTPLKSIPVPSNVNRQRGGSKSKSPVNISNQEILNEIRGFREEFRSALQDQQTANSKLFSMYLETITELKTLKDQFRVVKQKADMADRYETEVIELKNKNIQLESYIKDLTSKSYADLCKKTVEFKHDERNSVPQECGATKQIPAVTSEINLVENLNLNINNVEKESDKDWQEVRKRRTKYSKGQVMKGGNTNVTVIQAAERKKYLHVWRLQLDTPPENVENHVKKICGDFVHVTVEKLQHKTKRDYSSFKIGVPESVYDKLCNPEVWPVYAEFSHPLRAG